MVSVMTRLRTAVPTPSPRSAHALRRILLFGACACAASAPAVSAQATASSPARPPTDALYRDPDAPVATRIADLLPRMTLEEKFWQMFMIPGSLDDPSHDWSDGSFGMQVSDASDYADPAVAVSPAEAARAHAERINAIQRYLVEDTRLGIPMIPFDEALHGLMRRGGTVFPQAIGLAATFDVDLVGEVAAAIAEETGSRGVRQILSPVVNIATDPRWGRVEESYGEDPWLSSRLGVAFVRAFESRGIVTTPKHFVANVGDGGRDSYPIEVSPRFLEEVHFPPFRATIEEAGARSVMTAYNSVDGLPATQNPVLLNGTLKREWGFEGFVISDAAATGGSTVLHHTEASTATAAKRAVEAGLDVIFQSSWEQHRSWLAAFRTGDIDPVAIDSAVARVLRVKFDLGLFEDPYVDPAEAARLARHPDHVALARRAAAQSLVLLTNPDGLLPLDPDALSSVAVIGVDAEEGRLGGYSGPGTERVSILDGLRTALSGRADVSYAPGPGREVIDHVVIPASAWSSVDGSGARVAGLQGRYFVGPEPRGEPAFVRTDANVDFRWTLNSPGRGLPFDWYSAHWTGTLTAPAEGVTRIGVVGNDGYRLWLDGELVVDNWRKVGWGERWVDVAMAPGETVDVRFEFFETTGVARTRLVWDAGVVDDSGTRIDDAVASARASDVAIVVAGVEEGEFRDRAFLGLPGRQDELIRAVAATETPTVVVLIAGSAVTMPWLDEVDAVIHAWYPGEEGGNAVADVLTGVSEPGGRLPITFALSEGQLPITYRHKPTGRGDDYLDLTGMPLFPFGHGLAYTTFAYEDMALSAAEIAAGDSIVVTVRIRNSGSRTGDEVVQLYLRDELASMARPVMSLEGVQRIRLEPGAAGTVRFTVGPAALTMLDADMRPVIEPGRFRIMVGRSSEDIRLREHLTVR